MYKNNKNTSIRNLNTFQVYQKEGGLREEVTMNLFKTQKGAREEDHTLGNTFPNVQW